MQSVTHGAYHKAFSLKRVVSHVNWTAKRWRCNSNQECVIRNENTSHDTEHKLKCPQRARLCAWDGARLFSCQICIVRCPLQAQSPACKLDMPFCSACPGSSYSICPYSKAPSAKSDSCIHAAALCQLCAGAVLITLLATGATDARPGQQAGSKHEQSRAPGYKHTHALYCARCYPRISCQQYRTLSYAAPGLPTYQADTTAAGQGHSQNPVATTVSKALWRRTASYDCCTPFDSAAAGACPAGASAGCGASLLAAGSAAAAAAAGGAAGGAAGAAGGAGGAAALSAVAAGCCGCAGSAVVPAAAALSSVAGASAGGGGTSTASTNATMTVISSILPPASCLRANLPFLNEAPTIFSHQGRSNLQAHKHTHTHTHTHTSGNKSTSRLRKVL